MQNSQRRYALKQLATMAAAHMLTPMALAQPLWPTPSKIVLPFPAGGGVDVVMRKLAEALATLLKATFIIDNRPGAAGQIAAQVAAKSAPDGGTIFYLHAGLLTAQAISGRINVLRDFKMVSKISTAPNALVVPGNSPYKTLGELIAAMKARPGTLSYGTGGTGSSTHFMFEMLSDKVPGGLSATAVPFKGAIGSVMSMLGGDIDFGFVLPVSIFEHLKTGRLRVLATTGSVRMPLLPQVPTIAEAGVPGYSAEPWGGFAVPVATPDAIVDRLLTTLKVAMDLPEVADTVARTGGKIETSANPAAFAKFVREELERDKQLVARLGLRPE